jgi:3-oxoacyl-[acyl-carrier protein] reductase
MRKRIVVTGSTGGIGSVLCQTLAKSGFDLILLARNESKLSNLTDTLKEVHGGSHAYQVVDFSELNSVSRCAETILQDKKPIAGLVMMPPQAPSTYDCFPDIVAWEKLYRNSFVHPVELIKALMPALTPEEDERTKLVIISGISSAQVLSHYATSNVLRCAWLAQAKTMAYALGAKKIHVNTVSLGGTLTADYKKGIQNRANEGKVSYEEQLLSETSNVPLGKYANPQNVSEVVLGLLGPFSDHLTGVNLLCDGGFTRAY